jgi:hypothetical protein
MEEATIPIPVSDVDHIATSVVDQRKSETSRSPFTCGMRIIVAVDPLISISMLSDVVDDMDGLHSSKSKDSTNGEFCSRVHLEIRDHENWQDCQSPICPTADGRVGVGRVHNKSGTQTSATFAEILRPKVANR